MLGGGATAIIAAIVIVATGFGNREKQIVPIMKVLDSARPAVAALVPEHSTRSHALLQSNLSLINWRLLVRER
jgi:hypothetical protein